MRLGWLRPPCAIEYREPPRKTKTHWYNLVLTATLLVAAITLITIACGGGDGSGNGGGVDDDLAREQLRLMVLQLDELPEGFKETDSVFSTNEESATVQQDPEEELAKLEQWGRILGYDVTYEPGAGGTAETPFFAVNSTASLYRTAEGARQSFEEAAKVALVTDWVQLHPGFQDIKVEQIKRPDLAEGILWLRITGTSGGQTPGLLFVDDLALVQEGAARGLLRVPSAVPDTLDRNAFLDQVAGLVKSQVANMREAQAGG